MKRLAASVVGLWLAMGQVALADQNGTVPALVPPQGLRQAMHAMLGAIGWPAMIEDLRQADVVFLGEQHDDPATHRLELAVLQALHERQPQGRRLVLSMEMFETDVQTALDAYLAGRLSDLVFNTATRPWPNYQSDYRPLIEYARSRGIPVVAANVPRPIAALVAKKGLAGLDQLAPETRRWTAKPEVCEKGAPWQRFQAVVGNHGNLSPAQQWRMYEAQCVKDATMARSIAQALAPGRTMVLHVQGRFHSDYGSGVPAQLKALLPDLRQRVVTAEPLDGPLPEQAPEDLADVTVYVDGPHSK